MDTRNYDKKLHQAINLSLADFASTSAIGKIRVKNDTYGNNLHQSYVDIRDKLHHITFPQKILILMVWMTHQHKSQVILTKHWKHPLCFLIVKEANKLGKQ